MLKIICGRLPKNVLNSANHIFNTDFESDWFNDPLVEEMVLDVDLTKHFKDQVFESPVLGFILPERLSGGVKGLILILKSERAKKFSAYRSCIFGDNCVKWIAKLSFITDFSIYMSHYLDFNFGGDFSDTEFQNTPINAVGMNGEELHTCGEVADYYYANDYVSDIKERYYALGEDEGESKEENYPLVMDTSKSVSMETESTTSSSECDYVIPLDSPFWEELQALYGDIEKIKPEDEDALREKIKELTELYTKKNKES